VKCWPSPSCGFQEHRTQPRVLSAGGTGSNALNHSIARLTDASLYVGRSMHERGGADDAPPFRIRVGKSSRPTGSYRKHVAIRQAIWEFPERQFNVRTSYDKNAITVSATQTR
jgi:hypothetical protein